jgi:DtxR family Mn-dependent transcriptional regulator
VRRHRLAERFLVDIVGLPWHKAHTEAGRWEHVISPDVEARFIAILDNPATCPHGSPIPGGPEVTTPQMRLADAPAGRQVHLARITEQIETDPDALIFLSEHGVIPGRDALVAQRGPDGTLILELDGAAQPVAVGAEMSRQIYINVA